MKPIFPWLISCCAGMMLGAQSIDICKIANEENESRHAVGMETSAIREDFEQPFIMGSAQISAVLQQLLSSDEKGLRSLTQYNIIGTVPNAIKSDYMLGSESLNRMLENMLAHPCNDSDKLPHIEPAIQL
ncbi:uncharacterized protein LOC6570247 [Drosophila grimshawi]|uniref:GH25022 n=1 Tax=Drosophila grimshawi TaxID=7222 RepID=B4JZ87_DROGR|nr:uncharacterized protein LOC6570247 [Drosophila grimshawi]EDV94196.1 GH25022 [Drosophila grimshawi]EDW05071.1 GH25254 [Drosophila grimshawi]